MNKRGRVFSGARPTGRQHLGNYLGAIKNYVSLQDEYDCVYCIVDVHALTTIETTENIKQSTHEMALDWLAAGIRPEETILFIQSHVPQVMELHTYLSMIAQLGKLTDLPTFKDMVRQHPDNVNYGLLGYPVLMSADILLYKSNIVPVGIDQAPHVEYTREIVRTFNHRFKTKVLVEPQTKHTEVLKVLGLDGREKMSKSLNNHIELASTPDETRQRIRQMVTDPSKIRRNDPGNPDICNVFSMHKLFSSVAEVEMINRDCRSGVWGCVDCKNLFATNLNKHLEPFRARRAELELKPNHIRDILDDGAQRARKIAAHTITEVREAMQLP